MPKVTLDPMCIQWFQVGCILEASNVGLGLDRVRSNPNVSTVGSWLHIGSRFTLDTLGPDSRPIVDSLDLDPHHI